MKDLTPHFKVITTLVCLISGVTYCDVNGMKDTEFKLWACYLSRKLTNAKDWQIAEFFKINPLYMKSRLEDLSIGFLLNTDAVLLMENLEDAYKRLELIKKSA